MNLLHHRSAMRNQSNHSRIRQSAARLPLPDPATDSTLLHFPITLVEMRQLFLSVFLYLLIFLPFSSSSVIISEIMAAPRFQQERISFVELFNTDPSSPLDLSSWRLSHTQSTPLSFNSITYIILIYLCIISIKDQSGRGELSFSSSSSFRDRSPSLLPSLTFPPQLFLFSFALAFPPSHSFFII